GEPRRSTPRPGFRGRRRRRRGIDMDRASSTHNGGRKGWFVGRPPWAAGGPLAGLCPDSSAHPRAGQAAGCGPGGESARATPSWRTLSSVPGLHSCGPLRLRLMAILLAATLLAACAVGPNYHRPAVPAPPTFPAPAPVPESEAQSLADLKWFEVFKDDKLQELIRTALAQNYDLRNAAARVEAARANLGITRSNQFPNVAASGNLQTNRTSRNGQL